MSSDIDVLVQRLTDGEVPFEEALATVEGEFVENNDVGGFFKSIGDVLDHSTGAALQDAIRSAMPGVLARWGKRERGRAVRGQIEQRRAQLLDALGEQPEALYAWADAFRDYPDRKALIPLLDAAEGTGDESLIVQAWNVKYRALEEPTLRADAARKLAVHHMANLRYAEAETACQNVLELAANDPKASNILSELADIRKARESLIAALRGDVDKAGDDASKASAELALAEVLLQEESTRTDGLQALENAFEHDPTAPNIAALLIEHLAASRNFERVVAIAPRWLETVDSADHFQVHQAVGLALAQGDEGVREHALEHLTQAHALKSADPETVDALDQLLCGEKRFDECTAVLQTARRVSRVRTDERRWLSREATIRWNDLGDIDEAEKMFRRIRATDPRSLDALAFYEDYFGRNQDWKRLHAVLSQKFTLVDPSERVDVAIQMADVAEGSMRNLDKAIDAYKRVLAEMPGEARASDRLIALYEKSGKWHALIEFLNAQIRQLPAESANDQVALLFQIIDVYQDADKLPVEEMVIQTYNRIVQLSPTNTQALDHLAERYEDAHRWSELVQVLRKKIATCAEEDELLDLYLQVADLYVSKMSNESQAIPFLELVLELDPQNLQVVRKLRQIYKGKHNLERLCVTYEAELDLLVGDDREPLLNELATLTADKLYRYDDAIEYLNELITLNPRNEKAYKTLERLLMQTERWDDAVALLEERLASSRTKRKKLEQLQRIGELLFDRLDRPDQAADVYNQILTLNPRHSGAADTLKKIYIAQQNWGALKQFYTEHEDWRGYIQTLDDALVDMTDVHQRVEVQCEIARVLETWLDDLDGAVARLERVLVEAPDNVAVARTLESHYSAQDNRVKQVAVLQRIVDGAESPQEAKDALEHGIALLEADEHADEAFDWVCRLAEMELEQGRFEHGDRLDHLANEADRYGDFADWLGAVGETAPDQSLRRVILLRRGTILHDQLDRNLDAIQVYESLASTHDTDLEPLTILEKLTYQEQDWTRLEQVLWRQIDIHQGSDDENRQDSLRSAYLKIAQLREDLFEDSAQAIACYQSVLDLCPGDRTSLDGLERIYRAEERWQDLLAFLRNDMDRVTDPADVHSHRISVASVLHRHLDDVDGALDEYSLILTDQSDHAEAHAALEGLFDSGRGQVRAGRLLEPELRRAERYSRLAEVLANRLDAVGEPMDRSVILEELATIQEQYLGSPELAFRYRHERVGLEPEDATARGELERLAGQLDRWSEVAGLYRYVLALDEHDDEIGPLSGTVRRLSDAADENIVVRRLAEIYEAQLSDLPQATHCYSIALRFDPQDVVVVEALERLYARQQDWSALLDTHVAKLELIWDPEPKATLLEQICRLLCDELGRSEEAIPYYCDLLELQENDRDVMGQLESIYREFAHWEPLVALLSRRITVAESDAERIQITLETGVINRDELCDFNAAVDAFSTVLVQDPEHREAVDALHLVLRVMVATDDDTVVLRACDILEPWYSTRGEWQREVEVLRSRASHTVEETAMASIYRTIAVRYEAAGAEQATAAFDAYLEAFQLEPSNPEGEAGLERLARSLERWKVWVDALEDAMDTDDHALAIPLLLKAGQTTTECLNDPHRAIAAYARALEMDPANETALDALNTLYAEVGQDADRVPVLHKLAEVVTDENRRRKTMHAVGILHEKSGELNDAIEAFSYILQHGDAASEDIARDALDHLESLYEQTEHWLPLVELLLQKVDVTSGEAEKLTSLLRAAELQEERLDDLVQASTLYDRMRSIDPTNAAANRPLRRILTELENWDDLEILLLDLRARDVDDEQAVQSDFELGLLYENQLARLSDAVDHYEVILDKSPQHGGALDGLTRAMDDMEMGLRASRVLARLYEEQSQVGRLAEVLSRQVDQWPEAIEAGPTLVKLAGLYRDELHDTGKAFDCLCQASRINWREPKELRSSLVRLVAETGRWRELDELERQLLDELVEMEDRIALLKDMSRVARRQQQDMERAETLVAQVLDEDPSDLEAMEDLCAIYKETDRLGDMLEVLHRKAEVTEDPEERIAILFGVAKSQQSELNDVDAAMDTYEQILVLNPEEWAAYDRQRSIWEEQEDWNAVLEVLERRLSQSTGAQQRVSLQREMLQISYEQVADWDRAFSLAATLLDTDSADPIVRKVLEQMHQDGAAVQRVYDVLYPMLEAAEEWDPLILLSRSHAQHDDVDLNDARSALERIYRVQTEIAPDPSGAYGTLTALVKQVPDESVQWIRLQTAADAAGTQADLAAFFEALLDDLSDPAARAQLATRTAEIQESLGRSDEAIRLHRLACDEDETCQPAFDALMRLTAAAEDWDGLVSLHREAAEIAMDEEERVNHWLAMVTLQEERLNDSDAAIATLTHIVEEVPSDRAARARLETLYDSQGRWDDLETLYEGWAASVTESDERLEILLRLAQLLWTRREDVPTALATFQQVLSEVPTHAGVVQALEERLQLGTDDENTLGQIADVLEDAYSKRKKSVDWQSWIAVYQAQAKASSDDATQVERLWCGAEMIRKKGKDAQLAASWYESIVEVEGSHAPALAALDKHYSQQEDWDPLARILRLQLDFVEPADERGSILYRLADVCEQINDTEGTIAALSDALVTSPGDAGIRTRLQSIAHRANRHDLLATAYREVLESAVDVDVIRDTNGYLAQVCEEHLGLLDEAVDRYRDVLAYDEFSVTALTALRRLFERLERWEDLVDILGRIIGQASSDTIQEARLALANVLQNQCDDPEEAIVQYKEVLWADGSSETARSALLQIADSQPFLRKTVTEILSPILENDNRWDDSIRLLLLSADDEEMPREKARIYKRIYDLYGQQLKRPVDALHFGMKAVLTDSEMAYLAPDLERLSEELGHWEDLLSLYSGMAEGASSDESQAQWFVKAGTVCVDKLERLDGGAEFFERALEIDPEFVEALDAMRALSRRRGRLADAIRFTERKAELPIPSSEQISLYREAAELAQSLGDFKAVVTALSRLLELDAGDLAALSQLESVYREQADYENVCEVLDRRTEVVDDLAEQATIRSELGDIRLNHLDDVGGAIDAYEEVLEIDSAHSNALHVLEKLYTQMGQWSDVVRTLERRSQTVDRDGEKEVLLYRLGQVEERELQNLSAAILHYEAVASINPMHETAIDDLIRIYTAEERWEELCAALNRKSKLVTDSAAQQHVCVQMAEIYSQRLGQPAEAMSLLEGVLAENPESVTALGVHAKLLEQAGEHDRAKEAYEQLVRTLSPSNDQASAAVALAKLFLEQWNEPERALEPLEKALKVDKTHREAISLRKEAFARLEDWDALAKVLKREYKDCADDQQAADVAYELAMLNRERRGDEDAAFDWLSRGYERKRDHRSIVEAMIEANTEREDWDNVARLVAWLISYLEAKKEYAEVGERAYKLGALYEQMQDPERALQYYRITAKYDSQNVPNLLALGRLYLAKGNSDKALQTYQGLLLLQHDIPAEEDKCAMFLGLAKACVEVGETAKAKRHLARLLALAPDHSEALALQKLL